MCLGFRGLGFRVLFGDTMVPNDGESHGNENGK